MRGSSGSATHFHVSPSEYQELIEFLGRQFTAIDQRFGATDHRLVAIDRRFVAIDERFDRLETADASFRLEILGHFDELYRRLERVEQEYQAAPRVIRLPKTDAVRTGGDPLGPAS